MTSVKELLDTLKTEDEKERALVEKAYRFSEEAHREHKRFSGEPYFVHAYATAKGLAEIGMDGPTVAAGLLHDTVEDAEVSPETIEQEFGREVRFLVEGVTKLGHLKYRGLERHRESLRKLFVATSEDVRVLIVKLFDRLHNMQTLEHVPEKKRQRIALETLDIFAPLAHRLGMGVLRRDLEDHAFPYINPKAYKETKELLGSRSKERMTHLEKMVRSLKKELAKNGILEFKSDYRVKGLYSLFRKLERKSGDIEKIYDILALRIVVPSVADCYKVLGIIHNTWRPLPGKIKDYIAFPKPNGYQSLHTTIFTGDGSIVEIQIRTEEMHQKAEFGIASHFLYKGVHGKEKLRRQSNVEWLRQLLPKRMQEDGHSGGRHKKIAPGAIPEWVGEIGSVREAENEELLDTLKSDFINQRVFVFTPKGDVVDLPADSSPIDFAYAIHSDIGDHAAGSKVNGKMVPLSTRLQNGDIVEIAVKQGAKPSYRWLEHARTTLAKRHIRSALEREKTKTR